MNVPARPPDQERSETHQQLVRAGRAGTTHPNPEPNTEERTP